MLLIDRPLSAALDGILPVPLARVGAGFCFKVVKDRMTYDAICSKCGPIEIRKRMTAPFPARHACGGYLSRLYSPVPVHYNVPGFYTSDFAHYEKQVGPERAAQVRAKNDDVMKRAKVGKLTPYERRLDALQRNTG